MSPTLDVRLRGVRCPSAGFAAVYLCPSTVLTDTHALIKFLCLNLSGASRGQSVSFTECIYPSVKKRGKEKLPDNCYVQGQLLDTVHGACGREPEWACVWLWVIYSWTHWVQENSDLTPRAPFTWFLLKCDRASLSHRQIWFFLFSQLTLWATVEEQILPSRVRNRTYELGNLELVCVARVSDQHKHCCPGKKK